MMDSVQDLIDFRALTASHSGCDEALAYLDACIAQGFTLKQAAERAVELCGPEGETFRFWVRTEMRDVISEEFRACLTDLLTRDNPRMAAHIDIYFADLNADEIQMVTSRWSAEDLPNIARQLADGTVRRAREA